MQDQWTVHRRSFIGGSDARIIMGEDERAPLRLWREKRGEVEPEDLSGNLLVQLGSIATATSTGTGTNAIGTRLSKTSGAGRATLNQGRAAELFNPKSLP